MTRTNKHREIFDALHSDILSGKYADDGRLPSEEALCRRWKVSRPTVARALRDLQLQGMIERRAGSGTFVKAETRPLQVTLGLLVEGLGKTEILDPICAEITRAAQARGCGVFTGGLPPETTPEQLAAEWAASGVKGVFFAPLEHGVDREARNFNITRALAEAGLCVLLVDRDTTEYPMRSSYDLVAMDNFQAGCAMGQYMAGAGAQRIAFVARPEYPSTTDLRLAGVREGVRLANDTASVDFLVGHPEDEAFVERLLRYRPGYDAAICSNDLTAAHLMKALVGQGKRVPKDIRLAGFDDAGYASLLSVPLTTVRQPCRAIGTTCIDTLLGRLRHPELPPRSILLPGELVARASV
jgi:LacI family transcriptional regulator